MGFQYFLAFVLIVYPIYYIGMVAFDIRRMNKQKESSELGHEVDISEAVAGYEARDASEILASEMNDEMVPFDEAGFVGEPVATADDNMPFSTESEPAPAAAPTDEATHGSAGNFSISYSPEDENETVTNVNVNGGMSPVDLQSIFEKMSHEKSIFGDVIGLSA